MTPETLWDRIRAPFVRAYWWACALVLGCVPCLGWCRPRRMIDPDTTFCAECMAIHTGAATDEGGTDHE